MNSSLKFAGGAVLCLLLLVAGFKACTFLAPALAPRNLVQNNASRNNEVWQVREYLEQKLPRKSGYDPVYWGKVEQVDTNKYKPDNYELFTPEKLVIHAYRTTDQTGDKELRKEVFFIDTLGYVSSSIKYSTYAAERAQQQANTRQHGS